MSFPRMAILISGTGSNMEVLLRAVNSGELKACVTFVGSDNPCAKGLAVAASLGTDTKVFSYKGRARQEAEEEIAQVICETKSDWIILAGFMKILSIDFVKKFEGRVVNIHPALLPSFPGAHAIEDAFLAKAPFTGVTVHLVDSGVDTGPILAQEKVPMYEDDTIDTLSERIHKAEHKLYKETLQNLFAKSQNS